MNNVIELQRVKVKPTDVETCRIINLSDDNVALHYRYKFLKFLETFLIGSTICIKRFHPDAKCKSKIFHRLNLL